MPQFEVYHSSEAATARFRALDEFTTAYLEAALWLLDNETRDQIDANPYEADTAVLSDAAIATARKDCATFQTVHADILAAAYAHPGYGSAAQAGHDFFLTRNRHGAGFWDRGLPDAIGKALTDAAEDAGEDDLYLGDDGKLYFS